MSEKTELMVRLSTMAVQRLVKSGFAGLSDFPDYDISLRIDGALAGETAVLDFAGSRAETRTKMAYIFPHGLLPNDITRLVNLAYEESLRCFERHCSMAAIGMCGRTIETVVAAFYAKEFAKHPSDEPPNNRPGFDAIMSKLKNAGYRFPAGISERMKIISLHRNMAIHGNIVLPSQDEARSTIYFTKDVLQILAQANEPPSRAEWRRMIIAEFEKSIADAVAAANARAPTQDVKSRIFVGRKKDNSNDSWTFEKLSSRTVMKIIASNADGEIGLMVIIGGQSAKPDAELLLAPNAESIADAGTRIKEFIDQRIHDWLDASD